MSNVLVEEISLENIANAIRSKNGLSSTYTPSQMASAINTLPKNGFDINDVATRNIVGSISGTASKIDKYAFYNCYSLITANFPNCTSIESSAFHYCSSLATASFPNCTYIGSYAFHNCYSLTTVNFSNCTYIGNYAFVFCSSLTTASFPNCTNIGTGPFSNCAKLATVSFPSCTSIGGYAFAYCYSLITVNFPSCTSIGSYAFAGCSSLTTISFPNCTSISSYTFSYCSSLTTVNLPNCSNIGTNAFRNCYNLLSLYLNGVSVVTALSTSVFLSTPIGGYTTSTGGVYGSVFVPTSLLTSFKTATNWAAISARIVGCSTLTSNTYAESSNFTRYGLTFVTDTTTGIVTVNGTATSDTYYTILDGPYPKESKTYHIFGCPPGGTSSTYYGEVEGDNDSAYDYGNGATISGIGDMLYAMYFQSGTTYSNFKFKPAFIEV